MTRFIEYREFTDNDLEHPRLEDCLGKPYENQNKIVKYLLSAKATMAMAGRDRDIYTNEVIPYEAIIYEDGKFSWGSQLAYYVEKYNLRLPKEFETHILEKLKTD